MTGGEFLLKHVMVKNSARCYFATTEDGQPCKLQRKPYTECFFVMALAELFRATGEQRYQVWLCRQLVVVECMEESVSRLAFCVSASL